MAVSNTKAWLEKVLASDALTEAELNRIVKECTERQHLDFKSGQEFVHGDPAATLRDYAAAYGNSDGGVIIFGYSEASGTFDGVGAVGGATPHHWAARTLSSLVAYFSPPPRIIETKANGKLVLVVAVARAPRLVPLVSKGELIYRIRLGDSNLTVPPWLMSDLVLGRRNAPQLEIRSSRGEFRGQPEELVVNILAGTVAIELEIENAGLLDAEGVRIGLVGWITPPRKNHEAAGPALLAYVDDLGTDGYEAQDVQPPWLSAHIRANEYDFGLRSFERTRVSIFLPVPLFKSSWEEVLPPKPDGTNAMAEIRWKGEVRRGTILRGRVRQECALYVMTRNAEPWFWQVRATYEGQGGRFHDFEVVPAAGPRPVIGCRFVGFDEEP
jgi:hypothetical protein